MLRFMVLFWTLLLAAGCGSDDGKLNKEALMEPTSEEMKAEGC